MSDDPTQYPKRIVGLSYDGGDIPPTVMLKAAGADAESILEDAKLREGLHVVRDPALVDRLYRVPMDSPISRELFPVMAMLLAHVLRIDQDRQDPNRPDPNRQEQK